MAYHVAYGPPIPKQYQKKQYPLRLQIMTATFLLIFSLLVKTLFPAGTKKLQLLLLPDESSVTQQALTEFVTDLSHGEPVADAFTAFCRQIISSDETLTH